MQKILFDYRRYREKAISYLRNGDLKVTSPYYKKFTQMIVEGTTIEELENFAVNQFLVKKLFGLDAYLYYIYARVAVFMQDGASDYSVQLFLTIMVPRYCVNYNKTKEFDKPPSLSNEEIERIKALKKERKMESLFEFEMCEDSFSKIINQLSEHNIGQLIRKNSCYDFARALKYSTPETINKILCCCSVEGVEGILDCLEYYKESIKEWHSQQGKRQVLSQVVFSDIQSVKIENEK